MLDPRFSKLTPSYFLLALLILLHVAATYVLFQLRLDSVSFVFLCCLIISCLYYSFKRVLGLSADSVSRIAVSTNQPWLLEFNKAEAQKAVVLPSSVVTRYFMLLYLQLLTEEVVIIPLLIPFDSLSSEAHKHIRRVLALGT